MATKSRRPGDARAGARLRVVAVGAASVVAWIILSIGLGVGLPRTGAGAVGAALTVAAVISGVAVAVVAGVLLFRVARGWGRWILVPWVLVLVIATYSLSIALAAVYPPRPGSGDPPPPGAVRVDMSATDGVRLSGWYLESRNGAAVVLRHGAGSSAASTAAHARELHEAGYGVLAVDARGHGHSDGQGMELGWFGELDTEAAIDALAERAEIDPRRIGVVGISMGGEEAIGAAGVDRRIRAVVAEGATGRTAADKAWLAEEYGAAGVIQGMLDAVTYAVIDVLTPAGPPATLEESVRTSAPTRFLLIAAGESPDEHLVAERLAAVDPDRVRVWTVPGADHAQALRTAPAEWRGHVVAFLDTALGAVPDGD